MLCFRAIIASLLDVWQFVEIKISTSVSPISSDFFFFFLIIAVSLLKDYHVVEIVLPWVSVAYLLFSSVTIIRFVNISSFLSWLGFFLVIYLVLYIIFLFIRVTNTCVLVYLLTSSFL